MGNGVRSEKGMVERGTIDKFILHFLGEEERRVKGENGKWCEK